jgi:hypothetical protein
MSNITHTIFKPTHEGVNGALSLGRLQNQDLVLQVRILAT